MRVNGLSVCVIATSDGVRGLKKSLPSREGKSQLGCREWGPVLSLDPCPSKDNWKQLGESWLWNKGT